MTALLWLQAFLCALLALAILLGLFHLLITRLNEADPEAVYRTADADAMARDVRLLQRRVPSAVPVVDPHEAVRKAARVDAFHDTNLEFTTPCPHPEGSVEHAVWVTSYNRAKAVYAAA